jgi:hypothetical protein
MRSALFMVGIHASKEQSGSSLGLFFLAAIAFPYSEGVLDVGFV